SSDRPSERTISPHCEVKAALVLHRRRGALDERDADAALLPRWKRADTPPQLLDEFDMPGSDFISSTLWLDRSRFALISFIIDRLKPVEATLPRWSPEFVPVTPKPNAIFPQVESQPDSYAKVLAVCVQPRMTTTKAAEDEI